MEYNSIATGEFVFLPLDWDTELFGVKCAKVLLKKEITVETWKIIMNLCNEFDFITINNENNLNGNNYIIGSNSNAFLVDVQVVFLKNVENRIKYDEIEISNNIPYNEDIIRIASNNFVFSRFYNDPNIEKTKADQIYHKWATSSFNNEDKYFAICKNEDVIEGFFLFGFDEQGNLDQGKGFMVVDKKYQGKGIGKKLVSSIEAFALLKGSTLIYGGTQVDNIKMVNHFFSNGYKLSKKNSIYHLWKTNNSNR